MDKITIIIISFIFIIFVYREKLNELKRHEMYGKSSML